MKRKKARLFSIVLIELLQVLKISQFRLSSILFQTAQYSQPPFYYIDKDIDESRHPLALWHLLQHQ